MKIVFVRGLPGSGKSTWVRNTFPDSQYIFPGAKAGEFSILLWSGERRSQLDASRSVVVSNDHYFQWDFNTGKVGAYQYDPAYILRAVAFCQCAAVWAMKQMAATLIVDNTHITIAEMAVLQYVAREVFSYSVEEYALPFEESAAFYAARNVHGVPVTQIERMMERWEG